MTTIPTPRRVQDGGYSVSSGASASLSDNHSMKLGEYGEYTTVGNPDSIDPNTCSMSDESKNESDIAHSIYGSVKGIHHHSKIGYYTDLYAGYVVEENYRRDASSGGLTTWILAELLRLKHVDGVIHVKKSPKGSETLFTYGLSTTVQEIKNNSKTRYYPVEFSQAIKKIQSLDGRFALVGIPSFIMEARLLTEADPSLHKKLPYMIGLICGHQKSTKYAENLAWQSGIEPGNLETIDFRKKMPELPANDYATEMTGTIDGKQVTITKKQTDLFGTHWGHGMFKAKFSDYTDDALNETADVVLGDAWLPQYTKDSRGTNIVIVRSPLIQDILHSGYAKQKIHLDEIDEDTLLRSQSGLIHHTIDDLPYRLYKNDKSKKWRPIKRIEASNDIPYTRKIIQNLRESIQSKSHIHYREAVRRNDWRYFKLHMQPYVVAYNIIYVVLKLRGSGLGWLAKRAQSKLR